MGLVAKGLLPAETAGAPEVYSRFRLDLYGAQRSDPGELFLFLFHDIN